MCLRLQDFELGRAIALGALVITYTMLGGSL